MSKLKAIDSVKDPSGEKGYIITDWVDGGEPPLNAGNLNHIENGIKRVTEAFNTLAEAFNTLVGDTTSETPNSIPNIRTDITNLSQTVDNISLDNLAETDSNYEIILDGGEIKEIEENE